MSSAATTSAKHARMNTNRPTRKLQFGVLTAAMGTIVIWLLNRNGLQIPPEVATAILTIISALVSYLIPPGTDEQIVVE